MGTVAGVPASTLLGEWLGWRMTFSAWGVIGLAALFGLMWSLPPLPSLPSTRLNNIPELLRLKKIRVGLSSIILMLIGHFSAYIFIAPLLDQSFGVSGTLLSLYLLSYGVAGFAGNWLGGWYAGRNLTCAIMVAATGMALSLLSLLVSESLVTGWLGIIGWGIWFGALPLTTQLYVFSAAQSHKESIAAISVSLGKISIAVGVFTGRMVVDHYILNGAVILGATLATAITAMMLYVGNQKKFPVKGIHTQEL